jgi:hypothetical protein
MCLVMKKLKVFWWKVWVFFVKCSIRVFETHKGFFHKNWWSWAHFCWMQKVFCKKIGTHSIWLSTDSTIVVSLWWWHWCVHCTRFGVLKMLNGNWNFQKFRGTEFWLCVYLWKYPRFFLEKFGSFGELLECVGFFIKMLDDNQDFQKVRGSFHKIDGRWHNC